MEQLEQNYAILFDQLSLEDQQGSLRELNQKFQDVDFLALPKYKVQNKSMAKKLYTFTQSSIKIFVNKISRFQIQQDFDLIRLDQDFIKFESILEYKEFQDYCLMPCQLKEFKQLNIIRKLEKDFFRLIDLYESLSKAPFIQINVRILENLLFFIYSNKITEQERKLLIKSCQDSINKLFIQYEFNERFNDINIKDIESKEQLFQVLQSSICCQNNNIDFVLQQTSNFVKQNYFSHQLIREIYFRAIHVCCLKPNFLSENISQYQQRQDQILQNISIDSETFLEQIKNPYFRKDVKQFDISNFIQINNEELIYLFQLFSEVPENDSIMISNFILQNKLLSNDLAQVFQVLVKQEFLDSEKLAILKYVMKSNNNNFKYFFIFEQLLLINLDQAEKIISYIFSISNYDFSNNYANQISSLNNISDQQLQIISKIGLKADIEKIGQNLIQIYLSNPEKFEKNQIESLFKLFQKLQQFLNSIPQFEMIRLILNLRNQFGYEVVNNLILQTWKTKSNNSFQEQGELEIINFIITYMNKNSNSILNYKQLSHIIVDLDEYQPLLLKEISQANIDLQIKNNIFKIILFKKTKQQKNLLDQASSFFQENEDVYKQYFSLVNYFELDYLTPKFIKSRLTYDLYPRNLNITLEEFNISLTEMSEQQYETLIKQWVEQSKSQEKFRKLVPLYFNIIKRGDSSERFLSQINQYLEEFNLLDQYGYMSFKSAFQLFYNNANEELKLLLLNLQSKQNPVPLLHRKPFDDSKKDVQLLEFNRNLYYVFPTCFSIISFTLSKKQKRIGATYLINKVFYNVKKFEISDSNKMNDSTIDIMFDFSFSGSRNLCVADAHGLIPIDILDQILPLFKLWVVQLNQDDEIVETLQQIKSLKSYQNKERTSICFLIRDSAQKERQKHIENINKIKELENQNFRYLQVKDLQQDGLESATFLAEIEKVSKFLFDIIAQDKQNTVSKSNLLKIIESLCPNEMPSINQILSLQDTIQQELNRLVSLEKGFFNIDAFPLRSIEFEIKQLKDESIELQKTPQQNDDEKFQRLNEIEEQLKQLNDQISNQKSTKILDLFCELLNSEQYYIQYLSFVELIRQFNEQNTYKYQAENQDINDQIAKLQHQKETIRQKYKNKKDQITIEEMDQLEIIQKEISFLKEKLRKNLLIISYLNVGIEMFWREIISQQQYCAQSYFIIEPAKIIFQMISKGEPFEFLDGDQLKINYNFLKKLIGHCNCQGSEQVLIFSVLGPQSSGKSTILNKIFGCHFWTSVGRCTKGIYLQLLKIHNKEYFNNLFDYILLLDTEGLQNPNQEDQEFDKKIALFVLAISDIILTNVKGDINQQFKNLIEMCIFTFGQMKSFTLKKQISWCFNQNNDVSRKDPFLLQLQSIANNLNTQFPISTEEDEQVNYANLLGISNDNIKVLGFASTEKTWRKSSHKGIYSDWRQLSINETFSEEAYLFGLEIIKKYCNTFVNDNQSLIQQDNCKQGEENQLKSLQQFIQVIEQSWDSIQRLPDLLEFSELIQHQQNKAMKLRFDTLMRDCQYPELPNIVNEIEEATSNGQRITLQYLQQIQDSKVRDIRAQFDQIEKELKEQLLSIKNELKISKKIFLKYSKMVGERVKSQFLQKNIEIFNIIRVKEAEYEKKEGFQILDKFVQEITNKQNEHNKYKENETLVKDKFEELWKQIIDSNAKKSQKMLEESAQQLFNVLVQEFSNYYMKSQLEYDYQTKFLQQLIQLTPGDGDLEIVFNIIMKNELQKQQFTIIENSHKNYEYTEIFATTIEQKLKKSQENKELQFLSLHKYFVCSVDAVSVTKSEMQRYLHDRDLLDDLKKFHEKIPKNSSMQLQIQHLRNFLTYLNNLGHQVDSNQLDELAKEIVNTQAWYQYFNKEKYTKFLQGLEQVSTYINEQQGKFIKENFCKLKTENQKQTFEEFNDKDLEKKIDNNSNKIVLQKQKQIIVKKNSVQPNKFNQSNKQNIYEDCFEYLILQQQKYYKLQTFKTNILSLMKFLMEENDCKGWKDLYKIIYKDIQEKMLQDQQKIEFNVSLIKAIMMKINQTVKNLNKYTSNLGVIFTDVGERCIYYFSLFMIWRILCYYQQKEAQINMDNLNKEKEDQFNKFKADVLQNKKEQSMIRGAQLNREIVTQTIAQFYIAHSSMAQDEYKEEKKVYCADIIKKLDTNLLEGKGQNVKLEDILLYIRNQSKFIENYVNNEIQNIKNKIRDKYSKILQEQLKIHLRKVLANVKKIGDRTVEPSKSEDYFVDKVNCPNELFKLVMQTLNGNTLDEDMLKKLDQKAVFIFKIDDLNYFQNQLIPLVKGADAEIQILYYFIKSLEDKLIEYLGQIDQVQVDLQQLNILAQLDEIKLQQIGCLESCPMCKRKCDEDPQDQNHKHQCNNGHQLRGMNGVIIGPHPSLFTCEEIQDDFQIEEFETKSTKKWKELKQIYNNWQFSCLSTDVLKKQKEKVMNIWNNNIGQKLCEQLSKDLGYPIYYIPKYEIDPKQLQHPTTHYILVLDDSGSMGGQRWNNAKNGAVLFLHEIKKNPASRVTVIIFNHNARCVIDFQSSEPQIQQQLITFQSGGTDFDAAFQLACDKIANNTQFQNFAAHSIFFYTDGYSSFPSRAINSFKNLPADKRQKIELIACSEESNPSVLYQIVDEFKKHMKTAILKNSVQPEQLGQAFSEVVSKSYHNLKG